MDPPEKQSIIIVNMRTGKKLLSIADQSRAAKKRRIGSERPGIDLNQSTEK